MKRRKRNECRAALHFAAAVSPRIRDQEAFVRFADEFFGKRPAEDLNEVFACLHSEAVVTSRALTQGTFIFVHGKDPEEKRRINEELEQHAEKLAAITAECLALSGSRSSKTRVLNKMIDRLEGHDSPRL